MGATKASTLPTPVSAPPAGTGRGGVHPSAVLAIDPTVSRDASSFQPTKQGAPSPWGAALNDMVQLANDGEIEIGRYYRIGQFNSANGAGTRKAQLADSNTVPRLVLYKFDFQVEATAVSSELWAALVHRETAEMARRVGEHMAGLS